MKESLFEQSNLYESNEQRRSTQWNFLLNFVWKIFDLERFLQKAIAIARANYKRNSIYKEGWLKQMLKYFLKLNILENLAYFMPELSILKKNNLKKNYINEF